MSLINYEFKSVAKLLTASDEILVPIFQRPYSWTKQECIQFLEDLKRVMDEGSDSYFIGSMFFKENQGKKSNVIIDGQQRLSTITILISVIRDILHEIGDDRVSDIDNNYIKKRNLKTRDSYYKINLSGINLEFFRKYIQEKDKPQNKKASFSIEKKISDSNRLLFNCYQEYSYIILKLWGKGLKQEKLTELIINILQTILDKFNLLTITVTEESEAFTIFETLNDRGLDLTIADLLKNYLFSILCKEVSDFEIRDIIKKWDNMIESLGKYISPFLKHYWNSKYKPITEKEVYKALKRKINTKDEILNFLNDLFEESEVYNGFINPEFVYWEDKKLVSLLNEILILGVSQCYPLLLSAKAKLNNSEFKKIISLCISISFRYSTICNLHNNLLERLYSSIANKLRQEEIKKSKGVKNILKNIWPKDEIYDEMFLNMTFKTSKLPKYILKKINDSLDYGKEIVSSDDISWEHIIPKNPSVESINLLEKDNINYKEKINQLSNMTILSEEYNRKSSNRLFKDKKEMYQKSKLDINKLLKTFKKWDQSEINKWNKYLLDHSKTIWKIT
jgi:uncharacterized protein with ParB-like and HNH nuclease domain